MAARLLMLAYRLRRHRLGRWSLDRWLVTLAWGLGAAPLLGWLGRGRPPVPAWHWLVLALLLAAGAALMAGRACAEARAYTAFRSRPGAPPPPAALAPEDKVPLRASGRFGVQGKAQTLAGLTAYWRTYATREHAVLAIVHPSRLLRICRTPPEDDGLWYIFIRPEAIADITPGQIAAAGRALPALRVRYREMTNDAPAVRAALRGRPAVRTAYLAFEDEPARAAVWADLLAGGPPGAAETR